jgi:DNA gyrase subunit B
MGRYTADDIQVLSSHQAIRKRPRMYVGDLEAPSTLSHLVEQVMCASLDEALSGRCSHVTVSLHADGSATVEDDGPGIPTDVDPRSGKTAVEILLTTLAACRAMRQNEKAKDFCGLGLAVVNALSETFDVEIRRKGKTWSQSYRQGEPQGPLAIVGDAAFSGVTFRFLPDPSIFPVRQFDAADLRARFDEIRRETKVPLELVDLR